LALEKSIPLIGYGWSPGQAPIQSSVMKTNAHLTRKIQDVAYKALSSITGDDVKPYFLQEKHYRMKDRFPYNIHPLAFLSYREEVVLKRVKQLGWTQPTDTDINSTNCLLNAYANKVHKEMYGFHPYSLEIAGIVRSGAMSREEGLNKLNQPEDNEIVRLVEKKLGFL
jgi:hypothetical protein